MLFSFEENPESRQSSKDPPSHTLSYTAAGEQSDSIVSNYAIGATPLTVISPMGLLYRQDIRIEPRGFANYKVTIPYGQKKKETGSYNFRFDTTGATVKIKAAKQHIATYDSSGPVMVMDEPMDYFKGAIGVKRDGEVEGTDISIPCLKFSVDFKHPAGVVNIPFARTLAAATGRTNSEDFLGHDAGELLFLGSTGSDGSEADAEVTYNFASSENVTDLKFGDIANIVKKGWHYAWVEFQDDVVNGRPVSKPSLVHVERVYNALNFADVFGWS